MKQLTENAIGKKMQLMWQNKAITIATIQSKLGGKFLLAGLNQQEAEAIVKLITK